MTKETPKPTSGTVDLREELKELTAQFEELRGFL
jgi:hypothetical protein